MRDDRVVDDRQESREQSKAGPQDGRDDWARGDALDLGLFERRRDRLAAHREPARRFVGEVHTQLFDETPEDVRRRIALAQARNTIGDDRMPDDPKVLRRSRQGTSKRDVSSTTRPRNACCCLFASMSSTAATMIFPISRDSATPIPRVVTAGVPIRIPLVTAGF